MKKTIAMAGWWTGWHVFPIRSLIQTALNTPEINAKINQIFWFGWKWSLEEKEAKVFWNKVIFQSIFSGKLRRQRKIVAIGYNIIDVFKFIAGVFQALYYLKKFDVDVVFCKWWFVALPVVVAGKIFGKKIIVHESDTHPWLVNRIASRRADEVWTGFEGVFERERVIGQILSDDLVDFHSCGDSKNSWSVIFVSGGSQGAKTLYEGLAEILERNEKIRNSFEWKISLGKLNEDMKERFEKLWNIEVFDFLSQSEMWKMYMESDICITRGGTTSLAEQKLFGIKSIIVPLPRTHDQKGNAEYYVNRYGDVMVDQNSLSFLDDMEGELMKKIGWKKKEMKNNVLKEIQDVKKSIWNSMLS